MTDGTKVKVLIVDDHPLLREGIARTVSRENGYEVCGEAEEPSAAMALAGQTVPDIAIVDLSLREGSGMELIARLAALDPAPAVLVLSMHADAANIEQAFRAGAKGYLTKGEPANMTMEAVRKVLDGQLFISERALASLMGKIVTQPDRPPSVSPRGLSRREGQVFGMIGEGKSREEIAAELELSVKTVDAHRERIKRKLGIQEGKDLLKKAIAWVGGQSGQGDPHR